MRRRVERSRFVLGKVGDVCDEIHDGLHGVRRYVDTGIPLLGVGNITESGLDLSQVNRIKPEDHARLARSQVSKGDVLVTITGRLGTAMVYTSGQEANLSAHVARMRVKRDHSAGYLAAYFNSSIGRHFVRLKQIGSTHPHINVNRLRDVTLVIPPRALQDAVAEAMAAAYADSRRLKSEAGRLLASVDDYVVDHVGRNWGADPPSRERPSAPVVFEVWRHDVTRLDPKRYRWRSLQDETEGLRRLGDLLLPRREIVDRGRYPFEDLQLLTLHFDGTMEPRDTPSWRTDIKGTLYFAYPGDLVFSKIDARNGAIGVVPVDVGTAAFTAEYPVYQVQTDLLLPEYLMLVLRCSRFTALLRSVASGHSGRRRIDRDIIEDIYIPVPPRDQQREIVDEVQRRRGRAADLVRNARETVTTAKAWAEIAILGELDP